MAETRSINHPTERFAVVTGSNKGLGLEICRKLATQGVSVVLTARDIKRGHEAVEKLKESGVSNVAFQQLDVMDPISIASFAQTIKTQFGKLDILVNNAGTSGAIVDGDALKAYDQTKDAKLNLKEAVKQTYQQAEDCFKTNYYDVKNVTEALIPLLELSDSARIVNVSSSLGLLKNIPNEEIRAVFTDVDGLTEEKVAKVFNDFLKDFQDGLLESKGWPLFFPAYTISKAAQNAYTRILAKKFPNFRINSVCPGYLKTDFNCHSGHLTAEEGAKSPVRLALLPDNGPSGLFFNRTEESPF